ncbi:MAG: hypothetical protein XD87_0294 [candidate division WS6 bacterium 36_33]|uniref:Transmembrane(S)protein n=1 Tax=candidate division WS6 bacterium 36_33 TaxID=1641388 RepID=A0A101GZ72_9BACT|nr:MAG: hypothetical protein XD87_0294 [candidate division WS6 bacterium 36_33]
MTTTRKVFRTFLLAFLFLPSIFALEASAQTTQEEISLFKTEVVLEESTDINIREEIHYVFPQPKRGIIREIPVDYKVQAGLKRPTTLVLNNIYYYSVNNPEVRFDDYERSSNNSYAIFKIGNPDVTITGEYVFVIDYTLKDAINYFDDYDELYLNITGDGWTVPIKKAITQITTPGEITDQLCFTGPIGSTEANCSFEPISKNEVTVSTNSQLNSREGLTVVLKMPKGTLEDTRGSQRIAFLLSNLGILLPVPVFFLLLTILKKKGKNEKITIIPHYEPMEGLYPLLAGYIHQTKLDTKHITAEIIQLAIDGYLTIKQEGKRKYLLLKNETFQNPPHVESAILYEGLFIGGNSVQTKKIPSTFYLTVSNINSQLFINAYSDEYFSTKRKNLKRLLSTIGVVGIFLGFYSFTPLTTTGATGWSIGIIISGLLSLIFSFRVDLRSDKGNKIYYEMEGLKMYINTAEKHRIEFHNNPAKFRGVFEKLLPYAIIFGLEKKWSEEFKEIYQEPPTWYQGDISAFNSYLLASSISDISRSVKSKSVAPNSAGGIRSSHGASGGSGFGGGSSGGGFGGGGGGSW